MLDLVRASALPSHQMMSASKGALRLPEVETLEILVYIAEHNKIFGESARLTLAGWDEASSRVIAADPKTPVDILKYWLSPKNMRPALFPILIENPAVNNSTLSELALTVQKEMLDLMIASPRVKNLPQILQDLSANHYLSGTQTARVKALAGKAFVDEKIDQPAVEVVESGVQDAPMQTDAQEAKLVLSPVPSDCEPAADVAVPHLAAENETVLADDPEAEVALSTFLKEHEREIAMQPEKPFHAIGGIHDDNPQTEEPKASAAAAAATAAPSPAPAQPRISPKPLARPEDGKRDSVLQKIGKLDIKGRIQLAMKGSKEERAILVRDGTKIIALAVLDSPKITDGEVEKFAGQKNVLEAVLRAIPMKRRFAKNYAIVRALVFNPRTPLDVSLGLMKNLLIADLKNLSGNKEVAETVRKLALRMFRQKNAATTKN